MKNLTTTSLLFLCCSSAIAANNDNLPDPKLTEVWDPIPTIITPTPVPSDAIVLLSGDDLSEWHHAKDTPAKWTKNEDYVTIKPGTKGISSKRSFCDMQLHVEFMSPTFETNKSGQNAGNSGIFLQGRYELQVLNSYKNKTYSNGQAGSIYKQIAPLVNASLPPNTWQTYDIIYKAPTFNDAGVVDTKAYVTVLHNGVLIQNHTEIQGSTRYRGKASYGKAHGCAPIWLQDHYEKVSYRNIWVREL